VQALALSRAIRQAEAQFAAGERSADVLIGAARTILAAEPGVRIDYVELVNWATLLPVKTADKGSLVAVAAWVGTTRLIDNTVFA
jgi:pantothenate synthetase